MAKFHVNSAGNVGACTATKKPCPLGANEPHYETKEEARAGYEAIQRELEAKEAAEILENSYDFESSFPSRKEEPKSEEEWDFISAMAPAPAPRAPDLPTYAYEPGSAVPWKVRWGAYAEARNFATEAEAKAVADLDAQKTIIANAKLTNKAGSMEAVRQLLKLGDDPRSSYGRYMTDTLARKVNGGKWSEIMADTKALLNEYRNRESFQRQPFDSKQDLNDLLRTYVGSDASTNRDGHWKNEDFLQGLKLLAEKMGSAADTKASGRTYPSVNYPPLLDSDGAVISPSRLR